MQVDVSWNPAWVGTEQVCFFKFDGERFLVISVWTPSITRPEKGMGRSIITWERVK
jgi:Lipocalin-like domain